VALQPNPVRLNLFQHPSPHLPAKRGSKLRQWKLKRHRQDDGARRGNLRVPAISATPCDGFRATYIALRDIMRKRWFAF
jgi:hypothetical protein